MTRADESSFLEEIEVVEAYPKTETSWLNAKRGKRSAGEVAAVGTVQLYTFLTKWRPLPQFSILQLRNDTRPVYKRQHPEYACQISESLP